MWRAATKRAERGGIAQGEEDVSGSFGTGESSKQMFLGVKVPPEVPEASTPFAEVKCRSQCLQGLIFSGSVPITQ